MRMSDTQKNKRLAHLLFYHERPERITHGRAFVMSNMSNSLTVAYWSGEI